METCGKSKNPRSKQLCSDPVFGFALPLEGILQPSLILIFMFDVGFSPSCGQRICAAAGGLFMLIGKIF